MPTPLGSGCCVNRNSYGRGVCSGVGLRGCARRCCRCCAAGVASSVELAGATRLCIECIFVYGLLLRFAFGFAAAHERVPQLELLFELFCTCDASVRAAWLVSLRQAVLSPSFACFGASLLQPWTARVPTVASKWTLMLSMVPICGLGIQAAVMSQLRLPAQQRLHLPVRTAHPFQLQPLCSLRGE